jgi:predicted nucleic acid-binding protein
MPADFKNQAIISDTNCLIALTNIGLLDVLTQLYGRIIVTQEIADEYREPLPDWITVERVKDSAKVRAYNEFIDLGESSAIALAMEADDALLIIDGLEARRFPESLEFKITGTVGVLVRAYKQGIIMDINMAISKLKETGFRLPANIGGLIQF